MENIKVSIITASYNYENYIVQTIESVLNQTYQDWELIIVDDGSKDNSVEVIKSYVQKDDRIKLYTHENNVNKGLCETLKLGLKKAKYDWIAFLESDDKFAPECLEKKVEVIKKNKDVKFIFSDYETFGDDKEIERVASYRNCNKKYLKNDGFKDLTKACIIRNPVATFSIVMLHKSLIENLNFDSPVRAFLDYYLWSQIIPKNKVYYLDEKLTYWRLHKTSYVHNISGDMKKFNSDILDFLSVNLKNRFFVALFKLKKFKKEAVSIRFGSKAHFKIFNFKIGKF